MHVPAAIVEQVHVDARARHVNLIVAVGGGSAIGLAKAIALAGGPPFIAIPTTYSGSEMTPIWGVSRDGAKTTGRNEIVRPLAVLYDPLLSTDLPLRIGVPSALNALAHCMEAMYAPDANPIATIAANDGAAAIVRALGKVTNGAAALDVRTQLLYGAYLAGLALGMVQMGVHHKLCHVLGGTFGMPHAETHAILLPFTYGFNAHAAVSQLEPLRRVLQTPDPDASVHALHLLVQASLGTAEAPRSLRDIGFDAAWSSRAAEIATASPYANPRPLDRDLLTRLLERAVAGDIAPP
jgi:maleylacetate reductase